MLCVRSFLCSIFSLTNVSISSIISSTPDIVPFTSCILLVNFASVVPVRIPKVFISRIPQLGFSLLILFLISGLEPFYLFLHAICLHFPEFLKEFINFLLKVLYHSHKGSFKIFFLRFNFVGIFRAMVRELVFCSGDIIAVAVANYVFMLVS